MRAPGGQEPRRTTLAAAAARDADVRQRFERIGYISAGQEPALVSLQRTLFLQLTGSPMPARSDATAVAQRELLLDGTLGYPRRSSNPGLAVML